MLAEYSEYSKKLWDTNSWTTWNTQSTQKTWNTKNIQNTWKTWNTENTWNKNNEMSVGEPC